MIAAAKTPAELIADDLPPVGMVVSMSYTGDCWDNQVLALVGWQRAQAADPIAARFSYVTCYDQRGGGIEPAFTGDKWRGAAGISHALVARERRFFAQKKVRE